MTGHSGIVTAVLVVAGIGHDQPERPVTLGQNERSRWSGIPSKPGTGKSHVAKAVAYQATLQGYDVAYVEADEALARYSLAEADERARLLKG